MVIRIAAVVMNRCVTAVTVEVRSGDTARAADVSQAACFRASLAHEREIVNVDLAEARGRVDALTEGQQVLGLRRTARARFVVRELDYQLRELDRLIAALDRRFGAQSLADRR
jgi:hypothetical protein